MERRPPHRTADELCALAALALPFWRLDELCARAALALAVDYPGQASGRVRDLPDRRAVRYYTTLGLIDRPAAFRGRTVLYWRRHLLQLVAVKRLQTHGLTLAEIQARLLGQTDEALEKIARLPEQTEGDDRRDAGPTDSGAAAFRKPEPALSGPLLAVPLADGATLLLHAARPADQHDVEALRTAAAPLLQLLRKRRLLAEGTDISQEDTP
jgi:DNA-binding transcriptional MerR regulator